MLRIGSGISCPLARAKFLRCLTLPWRHGKPRLTIGPLIDTTWWDGDGLCLFAKRLERGRFVWPRAEQGVAVLTPAQLSMLLEGIDWRRPVRTAQPMLAG